MLSFHRQQPITRGHMETVGHVFGNRCPYRSPDASDPDFPDHSLTSIDRSIIILLVRPPNKRMKLAGAGGVSGRTPVEIVFCGGSLALRRESPAAYAQNR